MAIRSSRLVFTSNFYANGELVRELPLPAIYCIATAFYLKIRHLTFLRCYIYVLRRRNVPTAEVLNLNKVLISQYGYIVLFLNFHRR